MMNLLSFASILPALIAVGDSTNLTVPAVIGGVGVGAVAVALIARLRNKGDDKPVETPPTKSKHYKQ